MPTLQTSLDLCDHCYAFHQCYAKEHKFNYAKKQAVAKCSLCTKHNSMCLDCYKSSLKELHGSILSNFGLSVCKKCIVELRRTTDIQERIEQLAMQHIGKVQEKLRKDVYILTKTLQ